MITIAMFIVIGLGFCDYFISEVFIPWHLAEVLEKSKIEVSCPLLVDRQISLTVFEPTPGVWILIGPPTEGSVSQQLQSKSPIFVITVRPANGFNGPDGLLYHCAWSSTG